MEEIKKEIKEEKEKKETLLPLEMIKEENNYKLVIPKEVESKIRYACGRNWNNEWSGVLFYNVEGTFEDNNLKVTCKDICIMDIGSSTFTSFEQDPYISRYMVENDLIGTYQGLIHSHNTMSTFFSGTDTDTLKKEGKDRNHFLSLIVNNDGKYTAAITRKLCCDSKIISTYSYRTFGNIELAGTKEETFVEEYIEGFNLAIEIEKDSFLENIQNRFSTISTKKKETVTPSFQSTINKPIPTYPAYGKELTLDFEEKVAPKDTTSVAAKSLDFNNEYHYSDTELTKSYVAQLLTGSIIVSDKFDITKWLPTMNTILSKRFNDDLLSYEQFMEGMVEYIIYYSGIPTSNSYNDDSEVLLAQEILTELEELPTNKWIEVIKNCLLKHAYE